MICSSFLLKTIHSDNARAHGMPGMALKVVVDLLSSDIFDILPDDVMLEFVQFGGSSLLRGSVVK